MNIIVLVVLVIILVVAIAVSAGFITKAASHMHIGTDPHQIEAHRYLTAASVIGWVSVALVLVGGALLIYYGRSELSSTDNIVAIIVLVFLFLVFMINGILALLAASQLKQGADKVTNQPEISQLTIVGWVCVALSIVVLIILIVKAVMPKHPAPVAAIPAEMGSNAGTIPTGMVMSPDGRLIPMSAVPPGVAAALTGAATNPQTLAVAQQFGAPPALTSSLAQLQAVYNNSPPEVKAQLGQVMARLTTAQATPALTNVPAPTLPPIPPSTTAAPVTLAAPPVRAPIPPPVPITSPVVGTSAVTAAPTVSTLATIQPSDGLLQQARAAEAMLGDVSGQWNALMSGGSSL